MICKVVSSIEKYSMLKNVKSVAIGVSGGADSVCLLHILTSLKDKYDIVVKVVHVNHNIRENEALRDEVFVRNLCDNLGVELKVFSVNVKDEAKKLGIGEEECGRLIRYNCFASMNCDAVAVAHSLSDSIETMLFNLVRGTAIKGLCGIPPKREPNIIRPLIECTREEIEEYCSKNRIDYVTDSTNLTCDYMRNHIRNVLIPDIKHINSGYRNNISRCMKSLSEDCDYLDEQATMLYKKAYISEGVFEKEILFQAHSAIRKRVLHRILKGNMKKDVDSKHIALFDKLVCGELSKIELGKKLYIISDKGLIKIGELNEDIEQWQSCFINGKASTPVGNYILSDCKYGEGAVIDASLINVDELYISSRKSGDIFTFQKRKITKSLKKIFNEMKIPVDKRNTVAVLHCADEVVWVENIGVNSKYIPNSSAKEFFTIKKEG